MTQAAQTERLLKIHPDAGVAAVLQSHNFTSAMQIAGTAPSVFVDTVAPSLGSRELAQRIYARSTQIRTSVMHAWANVQTAIASPHYSNLRVSNVSEELKAEVQKLPDYEALFGTLDYCSCDECRSIFGAAAYLVDLLRVIDTYVTAPNATGPTPTPAAYTFDARRGDIADIPLTCAMTNNSFPMLRVVNERLEAQATTHLNPPAGTDVYQSLAGINYPFNLPYNLQTDRIALTLSQVGVALADLYAVFDAGDPDIARAQFGMSPQQWAFAGTPLGAVLDDLANSWGVATADLPGLSDAATFEAAAGIDVAGLMTLLAQGLSNDEIANGVAASFFINAGLGGKWLSYAPGDGNTPPSIANLSVNPNDALDRLGRFLRVATRLGWQPGDLDWALRVVGATPAQIISGELPAADLRATTLAALGRVVRDAATFGIALPTFLTLIGPIKPYGAGDDTVSTAPFDAMFNGPGAAAGIAPYHPITPLNPLYKTAPLDWTIGATDSISQARAGFVAAGSGVSQTILAGLATALFGESASVSLTLENLSALNRHAVLLGASGLTLDGYLTLTDRAGLVTAGKLAAVLTLDQVEMLLGLIAWLPGSGLSIDQVDYVLGGGPSPAVNPMYPAAGLKDWLELTIAATAGVTGNDAIDKIVFGQLATLFGADIGLLIAIHPLALAAAPVGQSGGPTQWEDAFTTAGDPPRYLAYVTGYVAAVSRWLVLATQLSLPASLLTTLAGDPAAFGLPESQLASLETITSLSAFQRLVGTYNDQSGRLATFVIAAPGDPDLAKMLNAATGWDAAQLDALLPTFASEVNRVTVVTAIAAQINMLARVGSAPTLPGRLISTLADPNTAWADVTALADLTLSTVKARIGADQWPAIALKLDGAIAERSRAALAPYVVWKTPDVTTLRGLSEYLLIDVEVSGILQISYIREALNAAQLYLQRCRLRLEPIQQLEIPEIWWEWLMEYRVWEANREVFLYPENYIDPTLRQSATPLFQNLENTLLQDSVTTGTVESAYRQYVDGLVALAGLEYVDAYHCTVNDPERGPVDTRFYFARTSTDPYTFSMISYDTNVWSSWTSIDVTIPSAVITPVYAFNRLYIFWVELKRTKDSAAEATASTPQGVTYKATIKCTYPDSTGRWIQPQAIVEDEVVYYMPNAADQQGAMGPWQDRPDLFQMDSLFWNKVGLILYKPDGVAHEDTAQQRLILHYGPLLGKGTTPRTPPAVPAPQTNRSASDIEFAQQIFDLTNSYNELLNARPDAYMPVVGAIVLDRELNRSFIRKPNERLIFERDVRENAPPLFRPELEKLFGSVMLTSSDCAYVDNFMGDYTPPVGTARAPMPVTAASLQSPTINATAAQSIFNDLVGNNVVVNVSSGSGWVAPAFGANPDLSFLFGGTSSPDTDPLIPQVRTVLLKATGDPTLYAAAPVTTSRTMTMKNQPGSFLFATGDETFLMTPADTSYAELTEATAVSVPLSSPYVYPEFFKPVDAVNYVKIFQDLAGQNVVTQVVPNNTSPQYGQLDPHFSAQYDLSFLFAGAPPAQQSALINQVRRILLGLPTLTMLSYEGLDLPRFVTPTSFITADLNAAGSQSVYTDLTGNNVIDANGYLIGEFSQTTDLSFLFGGTSNPGLEAEVRAVLLRLPKTVPQNAFVTDGPAPITAADSTAAFNALVQHDVLDAQGMIALGFGPTTDLSYLFPSATDAERALMISSVRTVLERFYDMAYRTDVNEMRFNVERLSARTSAHEVSNALRSGGIDALLTLDAQNTPVTPRAPFSRFQPAAAPMLGPVKQFDAAQIDFDGPYGLYYWELFFHTPMLVSGALAANQQFSDAKHWLEYILDPTVAETFVTADSFATDDITISGDPATVYATLVTGSFLSEMTPGSARVTTTYTGIDSLPQLFPSVADPKLNALMMREVANVLDNFQLAIPAAHFWQFRPFRNHTLESLVADLTDPAQIATYHSDPFDPHAIARLRIGAYEKTILMKYVDVLIAWGDMRFAEFTWESITAATLLYTYANDLLGPRPEDLGPCQAQDPKSYNDLKTLNPGGVPEFLIGLENQLPAPGGSVYAMDGQPFNAIDAYFCVPENTQLLGYWDTVADRLTKIRNGLNINGVPQTLALWDPPIDPMALVRAAASGGGALSIQQAAGSANISDYRFVPLLAQARDLAALVTNFGASLLAALEKNDACALDTLRQIQETQILTMTSDLKQKAIDEVTATIANLTSSRDKAQYTADHYTALHDDGLNSAEITTRVLQAESILFASLSVPIHGIAIAGYLSPSIFGLADGGMQWGDAINNGAQITDGTSNVLNLSAALTTTRGEMERRDEDWQFQAQLALDDVTSLNSQITAAQAQLAAAQLDLAVNKRSIAQSQAISSFLGSKFTSEQLYQWMIARVSALYFQAYTMALDAARKAELAYQFELNSTSTFISFSYWDSLHRGLLAGETLGYSLAQLGKAYTDQRTRVLQIEKTISLLDLDPIQVLNLRMGQPATFDLTETMLDLDFPGHYQRQIASVSITIPALVGPYQNLSATLIQTGCAVVMTPHKEIVDYLVKQDQSGKPVTGGNGSSGAPAGLRLAMKSGQAIAVSRGSNDAGVFELSFGGDQFMPFEGTGAVSSWKLAIPPENNRVDLTTITDVIIDIRYTAVEDSISFDGSPSFRTDVIDTLRTNNVRYQNRLYLDAASMFASSWQAFLAGTPGAATQSLQFAVTPAMLPWLPNAQADKVSVRLIVAPAVTIPSDSSLVSLTIGKDSDALSFAPVGSGGVYIAADPRTAIAGADFLSDWSLDFTLAKLPPQMLKDGVIDPAAILGIEFLIQYSADVLPAKQS
ncbi:Tc toxin subunit A-related protein [Sphingomonas psychrotolerans]|uniref:Virulence plasmid A protein n=1 Tax=Sphingomonas psychrotolerans TaxID=1327635 RepID=A0A2K8MGR3_9SPHN|nr:neuraminidase-like domain-containing protein [Sphingomonas psychrotolerans]ATY30929.1 hypothetical protein CVN68_02110 [Sphingomonas psychrotolerans]